MIAILEPDGSIRYESPSLERLTGYRPEELVGQSATKGIHPEDIGRAARYFAHALSTPELHEAVEFRFQHRDGSWLHVESVANNLLGDPSVRGIVMTSRDVTDRKRLEEHLRHQAVTDALTRLPNRSLFFDRLAHALEVSRRRQRGCAVLFLDLDGFKAVNDTLGHATGDELLREVGQRLLACQRSEDTLARFGGDEFAILLEDLFERKGAAQVVDRILAGLRLPFTCLQGSELAMTASIGVAFRAGPAEDTSSDDLIREADSAM